MNVGILGGGQLAQMLAASGKPLGITSTFLDPSPDACAKSEAEHIIGAYDDESALDKLIDTSDVITYEFENIPVSAIEYIQSKAKPVHPSFKALQESQDRLTEKTMFTELDIPTATFVNVESKEDLVEAVVELGFPCMVKTRRFGYDGKGQGFLKSDASMSTVWDRLQDKLPLILEQFVPFHRELSIVGTRSIQGEMVFYPLVENMHNEGILRVTKAPAPEAKIHQAEAESMLRKLAEHLDYVGTLALELFEVDGALLANEMAPRVHNTGHWSIEGATTSQFENHMRAITGMDLGLTNAKGYSVMLNVIGTHPKDLPLQDSVHQHMYGKDERPGRKLGHVTLTNDEPIHSRQIQKFAELIG